MTIPELSCNEMLEANLAVDIDDPETIVGNQR